MLTYQERGHVLIPNEPLFTPPPPVPPHRGRSVVFHNWRKAVSLPYPRGERPTGLPPHPCGELTEIRHPQGFFIPPSRPPQGEHPPRFALSWIAHLPFVRQKSMYMAKELKCTFYYIYSVHYIIYNVHFIYI